MLTSLASLEDALASGANEPCWLLHPDSWFELPAAARRCAAAGVPLRLAVRDATGAAPLADLALGDFQCVYETIRDWWPELSGEARPASLGPTAHQQLGEQLRAELTARADRELADPEAAHAAPGLPQPGHPLLATDEQAARFWRPFLVAESQASTLAWTLAIAERPDGVELARRHPWLRVLLQRQLGSRWQPPLQRLLASAYEGPDREAMLAAEHRAFAPLGLDWLSVRLVDELGLRRTTARRRPFQLPKAKAGTIELRDAAEITVLIPSYRHEAYIAETIRSVLAQSLPAFRLLVVDDRSPDGTVAAARAIDDPRLEVRTNEQNVGLGNSVLQALATITTPYVALLNSDDVFHPQRLEKCLTALRDHPGSELVSTGLSLIDEHGKRLTPANSSALFDGRNVRDWVHWYERTKPRTLHPDELFGALLERNFLATSSNLVCRTDWLRGRADALQSLKYCLDWQLFLDAAREGKLVWLPDDLVAYRLHPTNTVWFEEHKRWAYSLEVNRVAARAIRDRIAALPPESPERIETALRALAGHLRRNTEVDWTGLYLNELLGGPALEEHSRRSPAIAELVAALEQFVWRTGEDKAADARRHAMVAATKHLLRSDEVYSLQSRDAWQRQRIETDAQQLQELHQQLSARHAELDRATAELADLQNRLAAGTAELASRNTELAELRAALAAVRTTLDAAQAELDRTGDQLRRRTAERDDVVARLAATTSELAEARQHLATTEADLAQLRVHLATAEAELAQTRHDLAAAVHDRDRLGSDLAQETGRRLAREQELANARAAMARAVEHHDHSERLLAEEVARLRIASDRLHESFARVRGTRLLPGSGLARLLRRLRKLWRKTTALLPAAPWHWLRCRRDLPVVATTPAAPELLAELRALCGEAAASLQVLHLADGNAAARRDDGRSSGQPFAWTFPEQAPRSWRRHVRRAPEHTAALLASLREAGAGDDQAAQAAIAPLLPLVRLAQRQRAALLLAHGDLPAIGRIAAAARLLQRPWVAFVDSLHDDGHPFARWARRELARADVVVARSPALREALVADGVAAGRIVVRPAAVATADYAPPATGTPLLLAMGRLAPDAGLEELLVAAHELRARGTPCRVTILGALDPRDHGAVACAARLRAVEQALGVDADLQFAPTIDPGQRRRLLAARPAILVAPSRRGSTPAALDEGVLAAMASGLPIVGSDVAAITGGVRPDHDACIVPAGDAPALAAALAALAGDDVRQQQLARNARERYVAELQPERTRAELGERLRLLLPR